MAKKGGLGRGVEALLGSDIEQDEAVTVNVKKSESSNKQTSEFFVEVSQLKPNPHQPRREFDEEALSELADSIREHGIIQPIIVEETGDGGSYYIIAGERRTRAARIAGLTKVPVIRRRFSEERKLEIALIENIQREDLNPIEEAQAYRDLMTLGNLNQEEVASRVGKNRSTVANALRLLKLPEDMLSALSSGVITPGHARALLSVLNPSDQRVLFGRITDNGLSVRDTERMAAELNKGARSGKKSESASAKPGKAQEIRDIEQKFIDTLGTKVSVKGTLDHGFVEIAYFSRDDLDRIYEIIGKK
ncbi:ParB/RepB/Spo0J family partition protein [Brucepastera parasyntrophica]|uniref:ParB/RepB/Spo0J family partition protein n=1 Tax=Brucepastera parasyntrophica TaxID=2880008 RepID=UPI00210E413A|nr:ParB/RepB/Spo0J family partition protein [Brucepastera parasyntrophica]ULQ60901.1 ParB/RepB/Spo0J family partition protein [Brucepastera parasyntrophica]